jgi:UDP-galactopyranose mutase
VYSHLRWDFVYQRPQHVMTRLAQTRPILFIEEPLSGATTDGWERREITRGLTVHRPHVATVRSGFDPREHERFLALLEQLAAHEGIGRHTAWLYTPLAFPAAHALAPEVIVYDCMDELANFKHAPIELAEMEHMLLRHADVVFTGGPSLYRSKRGRHSNVHCFPSSVDLDHFKKGRSGQPVALEENALPKPRFGFFGVIDERFDSALIDAMAKAHPEWSIVLVGPVVKIDAEELPKHPNVHYLGSREYDELPSHLAGWDVCLLPFAMNDATRYISPTKTLEYMAADKPIVSSPIRDVAGPYGDIAYLGDGPAEFVKACERALAASPAERSARRERARDVLAHTSWDRTARGMCDALSRAESRFAHLGRMPELAISPGLVAPGEPSWL